MTIAEPTSIVPLSLTLDREGVGGITGQTPTVAVRLATSSTSYLDWDVGLFKTSGWGTKYAALSEVERGHYRRSLDLAPLGLTAGTRLAIEYHVDDGSGVVGDASDDVQIVESVDDLPAAVDVQLAGAHGAGTWSTATGFATPSDVTAARDAVNAHTDGATAPLATSLNLATDTVDILAEIDTRATDASVDVQLSGSHGAGQWDATADPAVVAAAVWDEPLVGHADAGSTGEAQIRLALIASLVTDVSVDTMFLRKALTNRLEVSPGSPGAAVLYDDDDATPLLTWADRDFTGGPTVGLPGAPARRSRAT